MGNGDASDYTTSPSAKKIYNDTHFQGVFKLQQRNDTKCDGEIAKNLNHSSRVFKVSFFFFAAHLEIPNAFLVCSFFFISSKRLENKTLSSPLSFTKNIFLCAAKYVS